LAALRPRAAGDLRLADAGVRRRARPSASCASHRATSATFRAIPPTIAPSRHIRVLHPEPP
jgi:hypothetical protein